jgi:glycosyltransferase involved in cell wall biosynthesis
MNKQKAIVILSPGFASSKTDSTCLPMQQDFVKSLMEIYPDLSVVILAFQYPYVVKTYNWHGATVMSFNGRNKRGFSRLLLRQKISKALKEIHQKTKIIGLLSFWYGECALVAKKFGNKNGLRHYCWIMGQDAREKNKYPKRLHPKPEELIALSDFLQEEFERNHNVKPFTVIPPGIESIHFTNQAKDIDIIAVGSLIPLKRFDIFIAVLAELKKDLTTFKAMMIGQGPERLALEKMIRDFHLESHVSLAGELPYDKVLEHMQRSKVLLHPSSYEGFSGVGMEALSKGAHVISFCQPMKQKIKNWHIVDTTEEMKNKTLQILQDPHTVYKPVIPYSMRDTVDRIMELFTKNYKA